MRIIKRVEPVKKTFTITCYKCHSVTEWDDNERKYTYSPSPDQRDSGYSVTCPVCGAENAA